MLISALNTARMHQVRTMAAAARPAVEAIAIPISKGISRNVRFGVVPAYPWVYMISMAILAFAHRKNLWPGKG